MYNATLFINTGFNAVNIPDNPSLLAQATSVTVPALDIYQARELSSFVVKASYANIKNADYLYLSNPNDAADFAYYSIQNITMTSMDTAVLSVTMDYILTAGGSTGVSSLSFTDGICERHHVALPETFGQYKEEDPYMMPSETMRIETDTPNLKVDGAVTLPDGDVTLLESTVDLYAMKTPADLEGIDFFNSQNVCTVPKAKSVGQYRTRAIMKKPGTDYETALPNVAFYMVDPGPWQPSPQDVGDVSWIPNALAYVRSLGIESCILAQYNVPYFMINNSTPVGDGDVHHYVSAIKGSNRQVAVNLPFERTYGSTIRNKRLFYGENVKYTITSIASGNSASFLPEEIYSSGASAPTIEMRVDPRPKGCPYFRFNIYRGVTTDDHNGDPDSFFTNAVKGLEWQNAPLVYEGASGSLINQYNFKAKQFMNIENKIYEQSMAESGNRQRNDSAIFDIAGKAGKAVEYGLNQKYGFAANELLGMMNEANNLGYTNAQYALTQSHIQNSFDIARNTELGSLLIQNNCVAPSMNFPISEAIRDYVGNTCLVYRTYYTDTDAARIDKILTMYGYKHTVPIENSFLTNRSKFNYIQARGVSINNMNIPKWLRDGVSVQFAAGVRIWHVLPDPSIYTNGTNT